MNDYEKLKRIIDEIDPLLSSGCTSSDTSFIAWRDKAELFLHHKYGQKSLEYQKFSKISYHEIDYAKLNGYTPRIDQVAVCARGLTLAKNMLRTFLEDISDTSKTDQRESKDSPIGFHKVFIVHGHDGELKEAVARIIEKQGIEAVILSEQANQGKTIIEKFENYSDVGGAICLFTADDIGKSKKEASDHARARQNVVFEAGYFIGKLGRDHIVILADDGIEMPSDLSGVVRTNTGNWQFELLKELKAMGYAIDLNLLF